VAFLEGMREGREMGEATLRDEFAMAALTGMLARDLGMSCDEEAVVAYRYADAALAARDK
jgi:hypothetical protein